jgi:hypothetical protein
MEETYILMGAQQWYFHICCRGDIRRSLGARLQPSAGHGQINCTLTRVSWRRQNPERGIQQR